MEVLHKGFNMGVLDKGFTSGFRSRFYKGVYVGFALWFLLMLEMTGVINLSSIYLETLSTHPCPILSANPRNKACLFQGIAGSMGTIAAQRML